MDMIKEIVSLILPYIIAYISVCLVIAIIARYYGIVKTGVTMLGGYFLHAYPERMQAILQIKFPLSQLFRNTIGQWLFPLCNRLVDWTYEAPAFVNHPYLTAIPKHAIRFAGFTGWFLELCLELFVVCVLLDIAYKYAKKKWGEPERWGDVMRRFRLQRKYRARCSSEEFHQKAIELFSGKLQTDDMIFRIAQLCVDAKLDLAFMAHVASGGHTENVRYIAEPILNNDGRIRKVSFFPTTSDISGSGGYVVLRDRRRYPAGIFSMFVYDVNFWRRRQKVIPVRKTSARMFEEYRCPAIKGFEYGQTDQTITKLINQMQDHVDRFDQNWVPDSRISVMIDNLFNAASAKNHICFELVDGTKVHVDRLGDGEQYEINNEGAVQTVSHAELKASLMTLLVKEDHIAKVRNTEPLSDQELDFYGNVKENAESIDDDTYDIVEEQRLQRRAEEQRRLESLRDEPEKDWIDEMLDDDLFWDP